MARFFKDRAANRGLSPGSLVFIGEQKADNLRVRVIDFDRAKLDETELEEIRLGAEYKETKTVTWINVDGLHEPEAIREIGAIFGLHPLTLEDILNTGQRPKVEEFDDYLFICLKMIHYDEVSQRVVAEQLSMILGETFLLTFQEKPGDVFEPVRVRIRNQKGRVRASGIDYLAYALLDTIVDNYIYVVERLGEQIEDMEADVLGNPKPAVMEGINNMKREMAYFRKSIRPAREAIIKLVRIDSELVKAETVPFLKDLEDLIIQAAEAIDTYREMLSDHLNIYNSSISNRMNDIMKVLTVFAAIFIPLTFIAGIYGTNFDFVPELHFKYSYFVMWVVMIAVAVSMLAFFKKKDWL